METAFRPAALNVLSHICLDVVKRLKSINVFVIDRAVVVGCQTQPDVTITRRDAR